MHFIAHRRKLQSRNAFWDSLNDRLNAGEKSQAVLKIGIILFWFTNHFNDLIFTLGIINFYSQYLSSTKILVNYHTVQIEKNTPILINYGWLKPNQNDEF